MGKIAPTKKGLDLFNRSIDLSPPKVQRTIFIYPEEPGRFDQTLRIYEDLKKKRVSMVFHYLIPRDKKLLSTIDAVSFVKESLLNDNKSNFDLPMLVATTGIKVVGYGAERWYTIVPEKLSAAAIMAVENSTQDNVALIVPEVLLIENRFIESALPEALVVRLGG